jgi:hypothetical protein
MLQIILKDGTPLRFTEEVIDLKKEDIIFQKELTKEEELLRPIKIKDEFVFIDNKDLLKYNWIKQK